VLAALAVLLIVGGALGAGYLVTQTSKRVEAIEIIHQVGVGQRIPLSAMAEVQVAADSKANYVSWDQAGEVSRFYAANAIPPGTLLNGAMVARANHVTAGKDVLGLALKDGQLPSGLQVGDHIDIYEVQNGSPGCPGTPGGLLSGNAIVLDIVAPSVSTGSQSSDVQVALNPANAGAVACSASNGTVGIAILPAGSRAAQASPPGTTSGAAPQASASPGQSKRAG